MHPTEARLAQARRQHDRYLLNALHEQFHAHEQAWLELARALAASGALDAGQLAQRLESHAARAPEVTGWFYGLLGLARGLRQASNDRSSLVQ